MSKKAIIAVSVSAAVFAAILIVATFFDLEISLAIGNADSVFGMFFDYVGETPAWLGIPVGFLILFNALDKRDKLYKVLKPIFLILVFVGFFFYAQYFINKFFKEVKWKYLYVTLFGLVLTGLSIVATRKGDRNIYRKLAIFAAIILASIALSQAIVTVLKYIWARQRFRNLQAGNVVDGSDVGFTPWYKPTFGKHDPNALYSDELGGKKDSEAYKSFPSGHSAAAAISFAVVILPELFEKLKKYSAWFYVVPGIYTALVMLSRIVNRAHFLSDVLFGGTIGIISVFLVKFLAKKFFAKYGDKILPPLADEVEQKTEIQGA